MLNGHSAHNGVIKYFILLYNNKYLELFHFLNPDNKTVNIMLFPIISFYFCIILENVLLFKRMVSKKSLGTQKNKTLTFIHLNENIKEVFRGSS